MSTRQAAPPTGPVAMLRWAWTQLTSMRTALVLLLLLALAAIPGSMIPQNSISPIDVMTFKRERPQLSAVLEPLGGFNVYTSPWFSAIYLLLFISLIGCIVPRIGTYARNLRKPPPRLPARPERLPVGTSGEVARPDAVLDGAEEWLRRHRYRTRRTDEGISAERGRLREAGNLVFHTSLVFVLFGLAWTNLLGFTGTAVVVEGRSFSNVLSQYDDFSAGSWVDTNQLEPFTVSLQEFHAEFETGDVQRGAARRFDADVQLTQDGQTSQELVQVNRPIITSGGTQVGLLGHGYAAMITVRDGNGDVAFSGPVVFLPQDANFSSIGVIKVPDARPKRLAFEGLFLPTSVIDQNGPHSVFPDAFNPELFLNAWSGDPAEETGEPQSVYVLDTTGLTPVEGDNGQTLRMRLAPGTGMELPNQLGSITFEGWQRWVKFQVTRSPGNGLTLASLVLGVLGLCASLYIRPRRLFVRVTGTTVAVGGLDRTDAASGLEEEVAGLAEAAGLERPAEPDRAEWPEAAGEEEQ